MKQTKILYLDGVDFQHELGETNCTTYASLESLKKQNKCWPQCGVVKIKVTIEEVEWLEPQDFDKEIPMPNEKIK